MKRLLLCIGFMLIGAALFGQPAFEWLRTPPVSFSMNNEHIGYATAVDAQGNAYMAGYKEDEEPYGSDILGTIFLNKYDSEGGLLYSKSFYGQGAVYRLAVDDAGNVYLLGAYRQFLLVDDLGFTTINQGLNPILLKFDATGDFIWHFQPDIAESFEEHAKAMTVDTAGNLYLAYDDYNDSYVSKFSPEGNLLSTIVQQQAKMVTSIDHDTQGNLYVTGSCAEPTATYNGVAGGTALTYNIYLAKYSAAGVFQWVKYVEDITCPSPEVKANTPDEVYWSSYLFDTATFEGIDIEGPGSLGFADFFIAKLNASGNYQWVREVPGNFGAWQGNRNFLDVDAQGNVYFAGQTKGTVNWGNDISTSTTSLGHDALVLKFNPAGQIQMAKTGFGPWEDRFDGIAVNPQGDIFLSGMGYDQITLDAIGYENDEAHFAFLAKISDGNLGQHDPGSQGIVLYPNPVNGHFSISGITEPVEAAIYDTLGQQVRQLTLFANRASAADDLASGVYLLQAKGFRPIKFFKL